MDFNNQKIEEHIRFICPDCGTQLQTQSLWRKHLNAVHSYDKKTVDDLNFKVINQRFHECKECHKWVANGNQSITSLQYHRISHSHFNLTFKCRYCPHAFSRKRALCDHLFQDHARFMTAVSSDMGEAKKVEVANFVTQTKPRLGVGNFAEPIMSDVHRNRKEPSDLIQKALLDSLIDLENETLAEYNNNCNNVNEFALDQSLNDLEAILKEDLGVNHNNAPIGVQYMQQQPYYNHVATGVQLTMDDEENELLEQICADIFEEVVEPVQNIVSKEPKINKIALDSSVKYKYYNSHTKVAQKPSLNADVDDDNEDNDNMNEKIISIEINAVKEGDKSAIFTSPKRKRLKIDAVEGSSHHALESSEAKVKLLLETYILYLCPECGREFKTQSAWRDHVFKVHDLTNTMYAKFKSLKNGTAYRCLDCTQVLNAASTHELQRHRFTHMPFQSYLKCTFCNKTKSSKPKIIQHLQQCHASSVTPPKQTLPPPAQKKSNEFKCSDCAKQFPTRIQWQNHRASCYRKIQSKASKNSNDSNISHNLNLIAHLKKMRARMRRLVNNDNATKAPTKTQRNNYSVII